MTLAKSGPQSELSREVQHNSRKLFVLWNLSNILMPALNRSIWPLLRSVVPEVDLEADHSCRPGGRQRTDRPRLTD